MKTTAFENEDSQINLNFYLNQHIIKKLCATTRTRIRSTQDETLTDWPRLTYCNEPDPDEGAVVAAAAVTTGDLVPCTATARCHYHQEVLTLTLSCLVHAPRTRCYHNKFKHVDTSITSQLCDQDHIA